VVVLLIAAALVAAGVLYQAAGAYRDTQRHPAPGRIVDIGCARLHVEEQGAGRPVVVLESGIAATSLSWALVQPKLAEFTRVCSYDRAGLGWSSECSTPRTIEQMVSELSLLLSRVALPGPYILVGHSFGGLLIRAYTYLKPDEVSGLVFLDPVSLEQWGDCEINQRRRLNVGVKLSRRGRLLARLGIVRLALSVLASGGRRFPKLVAQATAKRGTKVMEGLAGEIRKLPPEVWPVVRAHWSRPKCFAAMAMYLEGLPENARTALSMPIPSDVPFTILSASNATEAELRERDSWVEQSSQGRHIRLRECGHWIQLERPEAVADAVRALIRNF
jgi:pimeloyl-ACP methyl ester carboxylesterase